MYFFINFFNFFKETHHEVLAIYPVSVVVVGTEERN